MQLHCRTGHADDITEVTKDVKNSEKSSFQPHPEKKVLTLETAAKH